MSARRFASGTLLALWAILSLGLIYLNWRTATTLDFNDPDDFLRLQQVRDLLNGQGWFDLTQHRIAPPAGLPMHWSRLVDIPILLFLAPLRPLVGQHAAEVVAVIGAPLLTLLALLMVVATMLQRLFGADRPTLVLGCLLAMAAPAVYVQIHPARIDHHGWQIVFAVATVAALVQRNARFSGVTAGLALALYLNISIEGLPFAAAAIGLVALQWACGRDEGFRLTNAMGALAAATLVSTALTAPAYRWTEALCDAVMPSHIAAIAVSAFGTVVAVRLGTSRGLIGRLAMLGAVFALSVATFAIAAPDCVGSPFRMDPLVSTFWYQNVPEGMPLWRQDLVSGASTIGFPLIALLGAIIGRLRAASAESRRRWTIILVLLVVTLLTGAMLRRVAAVSHVLAVPGALVLIGMVIRAVEPRAASLARVAATALAVLIFSPLSPIVAAAAFSPAPDAPDSIATSSCDRGCALQRLARDPPVTVLAGMDIGPMVIANTPHSVYAAGYHRLEKPLRDTILFFKARPDAAREFMARKGLCCILVAPGSEENKLFARKAPGGMMARLVDGPLPVWLEQEELGSAAIKFYRVRKRD